MLASRILERDRRAVARVLTWIENRLPEGRQVLSDLYSHTGNAYVIGITGSPGSGKSSLTDAFVSLLRSKGKRVGIVAVDPTSPFTGGAILGDRVRMNHHATDPEVFIRSMGTRGALGGVARSTREFVQVLDAYGCDVVFVETVGVGQSEIDIMHIADTVALVLNPGAGDQIQSIKAGIMEIADLFLVNKADLPGADKTVKEVETLLDLIHDFDHRPGIYKTVSHEESLVEAAWMGIEEHRNYLLQSGKLNAKRAERHLSEVVSISVQEVREAILHLLSREKWGTIGIDKLASHEITPYAASEALLKMWAEQLVKGTVWKSGC